MNWEIGIDMYTLTCIKWMTNGKKWGKKEKENKGGGESERENMKE